MTYGRRFHALYIALFAFAFVESILAVDYGLSFMIGMSPIHAAWGQNTGPVGLQDLGNLFWQNSILFSASGWFVIGVSYYRNGVGSRWRRLGFDKDVFDLMVKTRGRWSRLKLLNYLETPKHRGELAELSGLSWKEVDRQLGLLTKYDLVFLHAESGSMKIFKLSEQGKTILKLIRELEPNVSQEIYAE